jgi:hypothetical protein
MDTRVTPSILSKSLTLMKYWRREGRRFVEVVQVPMTGRAQRNCIIEVIEVIERNQTFADELRKLNQKYEGNGPFVVAKTHQLD